MCLLKTYFQVAIPKKNIDNLSSIVESKFSARNNNIRIISMHILQFFTNSVWLRDITTKSWNEWPRKTCIWSTTEHITEIQTEILVRWGVYSAMRKSGIFASLRTIN